MHILHAHTFLMTSTKTPKKTVSSKAKLPYCVIHAPTGVYYVRKRIHGKLVSRSLKTKKLTQARAKVSDAIIDIEEEYMVSADESSVPRASIKTVGDAVRLYREEVGMVAVAAVFVCDNLSFSGEVQFGRKHTSFIARDLPELIGQSIVPSDLEVDTSGPQD